MNCRNLLKSIAVCAAIPALLIVTSCAKSPNIVKPNIILIMADDMGYGDAGCYNPESKISTPNIDKLASQGMRFTDAHAAGTLCTPSRYGLLTGRYPFRNKRSYLQGLIDPDRLTIASLLKNAGYNTACIGKWHQGMPGENNPQAGVDLEGNPTEHGFDYFFGLHASLDIPPYYYMENGQCVLPPSNFVEANNTPGISPIQGAFWRAGAIAPGFEFENVLDELTGKAVEYLDNHFNTSKQPVFLYFPLPSPHTPWLPNDSYKGSTAIGDYGDFTAQVDGVLGTVLNKLKETGQEKNTIVILTSDNGPVWYPEDVEKYNHSSTGPLRGMKADLWEGGHRMPFIVRWPGKVKANKVNTHLTCHTDLMATFAEITGQDLPENVGEDSFSILQQLTGKKSNLPQRENLVIGLNRRSFMIYTGDWKYISIPGSGGFSDRYLKSRGVEFEIPEQLYNIDEDIGEKDNLYHKNRDKVEELTSLLVEITGIQQSEE
jgi:arylsulfatase A